MKRVFRIVLLFCAVMILAMPTQAAGKKNVDTWITKKGQVYYYDSTGKKETGLATIKNKIYYFSKNGVQRTGWQKIKNNYYFFTIAVGKKGSMVKSKKVNGIKLASNGKAKKTSKNAKKLKLMVQANQIVQDLTTAKMSRNQKLRKCYDYTMKVFNQYGYATRRTFTFAKDWDQSYAEDIFSKKGGNCFSYNAFFAYLANAVGPKNVYVVTSGGHGWAEVEGKVYDPDWAMVKDGNSYFAVPYSLSGVNGRPNYARENRFRVKL